MVEIRLGGGRPPLPSWALFVPGAVVFGLGLMIWLVPALLITLVAGALMFVGIILLSLAWRVHSSGGGGGFGLGGRNPFGS